MVNNMAIILMAQQIMKQNTKMIKGMEKKYCLILMAQYGLKKNTKMELKL